MKKTIRIETHDPLCNSLSPIIIDDEHCNCTPIVEYIDDSDPRFNIAKLIGKKEKGKGKGKK